VHLDIQYIEITAESKNTSHRAQFATIHI
jgi:hypothetical protein